jgi:1-acyl-sn-glycerol-3-phosphate acyltransferase
MSLTRLMQMAIFALVARPFVRIFLGLRTQNRRGLPSTGPAVIVANHNSHLDTISLMALMPLRALWTVRPVAAADHFGGAGPVGFLARHVLRTILVERDGRGPETSLAPVIGALDRGEVLIFFPEGSRGEPEVMARFKRGIAHIAVMRPGIPIVPVYLHGMGKCMPKGGLIFVPFACDVIVGQPQDLSDLSPEAIPDRLRRAVETLSRDSSLARWDDEVGHGLGDQSDVTPPALGSWDAHGDASASLKHRGSRAPGLPDVRVENADHERHRER